jgi:TonB family protein
VLLRIVVGADGLPRNIEIVRGLGFGLDEQAIEAVGKWRFRPGTKKISSDPTCLLCAGPTVAVSATIEVKFRLLGPSCEPTTSPREIGDRYAQGMRTGKDDKEALRWYLTSARQGDALGQFRAGEFLEAGRGTTQNYREAVRWYRASAILGNAHAQVKLAELIAEGHGADQDLVEAAAWAWWSGNWTL